MKGAADPAEAAGRKDLWPTLDAAAEQAEQERDEVQAPSDQIDAQPAPTLFEDVFEAEPGAKTGRSNRAAAGGGA